MADGATLRTIESDLAQTLANGASKECACSSKSSQKRGLGLGLEVLVSLAMSACSLKQERACSLEIGGLLVVIALCHKQVDLMPQLSAVALIRRANRGYGHVQEAA